MVSALVLAEPTRVTDESSVSPQMERSGGGGKLGWGGDGKGRAWNTRSQVLLLQGWGHLVSLQVPGQVPLR